MCLGLDAAQLVSADRQHTEYSARTQNASAFFRWSELADLEITSGFLFFSVPRFYIFCGIQLISRARVLKRPRYLRDEGRRTERLEGTLFAVSFLLFVLFFVQTADSRFGLRPATALFDDEPYKISEERRYILTTAFTPHLLTTRFPDNAQRYVPAAIRAVSASSLIKWSA